MANPTAILLSSIMLLRMKNLPSNFEILEFADMIDYGIKTTC